MLFYHVTDVINESPVIANDGPTEASLQASPRPNTLDQVCAKLCVIFKYRHYDVIYPRTIFQYMYDYSW